MEKAKTAENILRSKYSTSREHGEYRCFFDPIPDMNTILKAMEEYAEQARREERENHSELVEMLKRVTEIYIKSYPVDVKIAIEDDLEHALAAAGYGKEES